MSENILITGVSSGIGLGLARAYLKRGASVFGISRRKPEELFAEPRFRFRSLDLSRYEKVGEALAHLLKGVPELKIAILNAGVLGQLEDLSVVPIKDLRRTMNVNVWANKAVLDALFGLSIPIQQVVTLSSGAAVNAKRGWSGYSISKAALNMLTALYAMEKSGTHFCAFAPGIIDTAMQDEISKLPSDPRFDSFEQLKSVKGTPAMPTPEAAAESLIQAFEKLPTKVPSGAFTDIRGADF
jgi:benzil reductase ((S)-benzoin forming)